MAYSAGTVHPESGTDSFTAPSGGVTKGKSYQIASGLIVVARDTVAAASSFRGTYSGAVTATKGTATADTFSKGGKVYYDATNKVMTGESSGTTHVGYALEAVASASTTVVKMLLVQPV